MKLSRVSIQFCLFMSNIVFVVVIVFESEGPVSTFKTKKRAIKFEKSVQPN